LINLDLLAGPERVD